MMKYIIANWKANKDIKETEDWIDVFFKKNLFNLSANLMVIICPPFPFVSLLRDKVKNYRFIKIGAQDISCFKGGTYTGEVTGEILSGIADYVIIGHSERRRYFNETDEILFQKFSLAKKNRLEPLFCVRNENDPFPPRAKFVVYEPVFAISSGSGQGNNQPIKSVLTMKKRLKVSNSVNFIYGGSVNEKNANQYLKNKEIDGVMVGGASLDPERFYKIITRLKEQ